MEAESLSWYSMQYREAIFTYRNGFTYTRKNALTRAHRIVYLAHTIPSWSWSLTLLEYGVKA